MKKLITLTLLSSIVLFTTSAFAVTVASTSKKGSVLKWPLIDIQQEDSTDTIIHISNDNTYKVRVKCYYMNEAKGRRDFSFTLTPKQTATWSVYQHDGTIAVAPFPDDSPFPTLGRYDKGELVCFAVTFSELNQIRFNHLSGIATIVSSNDGDAAQNKQAFEYNAWAFAAVAGTERAAIGTAGTIKLDGVQYDACPQYLVTEFSPAGSYLDSNPFVFTLDNDLAVASCKEDLRQDYNVHITKLQFNVWNALENGFTGSYICSDTVRAFGLDPNDAPDDFVHPDNFTFNTLKTTDARFQVQGVKSTQCDHVLPYVASESTGLIGVLHTSIGIGSYSETNEIGTTLRGAGADTSGYILWDPQLSLPPEIIKRP